MSADREPGAPPRVGTDVIDRVQWETLRRAAHLGHLQPEGDRLLQQIHARHPEWLEEWGQ